MFVSLSRKLVFGMREKILNYFWRLAKKLNYILSGSFHIVYAFIASHVMCNIDDREPSEAIFIPVAFE